MWVPAVYFKSDSMNVIYKKKKLSEWEMKNKADKNAEHKQHIKVPSLVLNRVAK